MCNVNSEAACKNSARNAPFQTGKVRLAFRARFGAERLTSQTGLHYSQDTSRHAIWSFPVPRPFGWSNVFRTCNPGKFEEAHLRTTTKSAPLKSTLHEKVQLMSASEMERTLVRLAHEILEKSGGVGDLGLVGIRRRGVPLAERIAKIIRQREKAPVPVGTLDITFYRDDLSTLGPKPVVQKSELGFSIGDKKIVLVDDVLFTGRTIRSAMDALFLHGRPSRVQLLVLIDRGHRELPIEATFIGRSVQTTMNEVIEVKLIEVDSVDKVLLMERVTERVN
ncbi:MAG TPA: bifunctional pyr operon transcriptional regulator/uracil phosphoribosyltransferase PyrR [Terriglobales bacterium]|nr:bifunctional pyr operon transcriptional regulator/uracil phosphoribosyltransferase PyrR [Terriglobales bacterium]